MFGITNAKLMGYAAVVLVILFLVFRAYQQGNTIDNLKASIDKLEAQKVSLQEKLNLAEIRKKELTIDVTSLKELVGKMDIECDKRVDRASAKTTVIEKRTYIPAKEAIEKGVLDEKSSKDLVGYLRTHIFN